METIVGAVIGFGLAGSYTYLVYCFGRAQGVNEVDERERIVRANTNIRERGYPQRRW